MILYKGSGKHTKIRYAVDYFNAKFDTQAQCDVACIGQPV